MTDTDKSQGFLDRPDFTDWIARFKGATTEERQAMLDALALRTKITLTALGEQLTKQFGSKSDEDLAGVEDLLFCSLCAFVPPAGREELGAKLLPLVGDLAKKTGDVDHDRLHTMFIRIGSRVATTMLQDRLNPRPHPFDATDDKPQAP